MKGDLLDDIQQLAEVDFGLSFRPMLGRVQSDLPKVAFRGFAKPDLNHGIARLRASTP